MAGAAELLRPTQQTPPPPPKQPPPPTTAPKAILMRWLRGVSTQTDGRGGLPKPVLARSARSSLSACANVRLGRGVEGRMDGWRGGLMWMDC